MNLKSIFKVALISAISCNFANADVYTDMADINRNELIIKACGLVASDYSSYAKWVSDNLEFIYKNSKPNSKQRDVLVSEFKAKKQESDDRDYMNRKKIYEIYKESPSRAEMLFQLMTFTRMKSYSIAVENVGLSKIAYQGQIEQECKYSVIK
jgi:hypothetical protein